MRDVENVDKSPKPVIAWMGHSPCDDGKLGFFSKEFRGKSALGKEAIGLDLSIIKYGPEEEWMLELQKDHFISILEQAWCKTMFLIVSWESIGFKLPRDFIVEARRRAEIDRRVRLYIILFDDMKLERWDGSKTFPSEKECNAVNLSFLPCYCMTQMACIGAKRLVSLIERIMGRDLPGGAFPDYDAKTLLNIARHINREDFNKYSPRQGALPKYGFTAEGLPDIPDNFIGSA